MSVEVPLLTVDAMAVLAATVLEVAGALLRMPGCGVSASMIGEGADGWAM